jgi:hypothetical protein
MLIRHSGPTVVNFSVCKNMWFLRSLGLASLALSSTAHAAVSTRGSTVAVDDVDYFLPPKPVASIAGCSEIEAKFTSGAAFVPFTVVNGNASLETYRVDDVWQDGFLEGV